MTGFSSWTPSASPLNGPPMEHAVEEAEENGEQIWFGLDDEEHCLSPKKVIMNGKSFEPQLSESRIRPPSKDVSKIFQRKLGFSFEFLHQLADQAAAEAQNSNPKNTNPSLPLGFEEDDDEDNGGKASDGSKKESETNKYKEFLNSTSHLKRDKTTSRPPRNAEPMDSDEMANMPLEKFSKQQYRSTSLMYTDFRLEERGKSHGKPLRFPASHSRSNDRPHSQRREQSKNYNPREFSNRSRDRGDGQGLEDNAGNLNFSKNKQVYEKFPQNKVPNKPLHNLDPESLCPIKGTPEYSSQGARPRTYQRRPPKKQPMKVSKFSNQHDTSR